MPFFSIITPAYNRAHLLPECLDSVLAQTFTDWECIVVDDGSTDDTRSLVEGYAARDQRFRYHWQENAGVSAARNAGIALATGEWVAFLDSDDSYVAEALALFTEAISTSTAARIILGFLDIPWGARARGTRAIRECDGFLSMMGFPEADQVPLLMSCCAVRRDLIAEIGGFATAYRTSEDHAFWIRATAKSPVALIDAQVGHYRIDGGDSKFNAFMASGKKLETLGRIYADALKDPVVRGRLRRDPDCDAFRQWHAVHSLVLESAVAVRSGDLQMASRKLQSACEACPSAGYRTYALESFRNYLFYPRARPVEATLRYAAWLAAVASHMPRTDPLDLRNSLRSTASDMCFYLAAELRGAGNAREAQRVAVGGLFRVPSVRSAKSMLRFLLRQHGGGHPTSTSASREGEDAAAAGGRRAQ